MAIPSMFDNYPLWRMKAPTQFKFKGMQVYIDYATDFVYRDGHEDELQGAIVVRVKYCEDERDSQYILPLDLYPRRVYADGRACCDCEIECRECRCVLCKNEKERQVWDTHDIHSDVYSECPLRKQLLGILESVAEASKREGSEALKQLFSIIQETTKEPEQETVAKPVVKNNFYLEKVDSFKFKLHYLKDGKSHYRTVKSTRRDAEETLKALEALEAGEETENTIARRIWGLKKIVVPTVTEESIYKELFELSQEDVRALKTELDEVKASNALLRNKLSLLDNVNEECCEFPRVESEIYSNETVFQLRAVLEDFMAQAGNSRRSQVIEEVLSKLPSSDVLNEYRRLFTNCIVGMSAQRRGEMLAQIGYTQEQCNNCHYKVYPNGHPELGVIIAATPSDYRSSQNTVAELLRRLFD